MVSRAAYMRNSMLISFPQTVHSGATAAPHRGICHHINHSDQREMPLAKPNYQFDKRQRDLAKKKKQDEKRQRKQTKGPDDASPDDTAAVKPDDTPTR